MATNPVNMGSIAVFYFVTICENCKKCCSVKIFADAYNNISDICRSDAMRICELREKEVINTCDCKVLGCVVDIDFDLCSGQIEAIIVPGPGKVCGIFGVDSEYIIPFACIRKIGPDIILVEIQKEKFLKKI